MSRYLLIALFIALVVCVMQARSAPTQDQSTTPNSIEEAFKQASDTINKAFSDAKPKLDEFLIKGQEFLDQVGKKLSEEAGKIIPKSEEKPAA